MSVNGEAKPGRRPRLTNEASAHLERLRANKAQLDLDKRDRERREEHALAAFAEACAHAEQLALDRDEQLSSLATQVERVHTTYQEQVRLAQTAQAAALGDLRAAGRTTEEIASLLELPKERVKRYLRTSQGSARRRRQRQPAAVSNGSSVTTNGIAHELDTAHTEG